MARIKVTGYLDTAALDPDQVDLTHDTGLSEDGFIDIGNDLGTIGLEDVEFEVED